VSPPVGESRIERLSGAELLVHQNGSGAIASPGLLARCWMRVGTLNVPSSKDAGKKEWILAIEITIN
jgi:hypothetical protein